jgi:hypothetical protein
MNEEMLQYLIRFLLENKILIISVVCLMIVSLFVVKHWLSGSSPKFFRSAFGIDRDYKAELQAIINQHCNLTQGLEWVYGDINLSEWKAGLTTMQKNIYKSYIIAFGSNRIVIIPILVETDKIIGYKPLIITKENTIDLKYSNLLKTTKIQTEDNFKIEYQVLGDVYKTVTFTDMFSVYDEENGQIIQPENRTMSSAEIVSKVNISQKAEQTKYINFIKEFKRNIDRNK